MVAGEHFAGSAEAGSNFVGNQQYAVLITELTQLLQVERRIDTHACAALHDRLNDNCSGFFCVFGKFFLSKFEAFALAMLAVFGKRATVAISAFTWMLFIIMGLYICANRSMLPTERAPMVSP